jgi:hypothetical protein
VNNIPHVQVYHPQTHKALFTVSTCFNARRLHCVLADAAVSRISAPTPHPLDHTCTLHPHHRHPLTSTTPSPPQQSILASPHHLTRLRRRFMRATAIQFAICRVACPELRRLRFSRYAVPQSCFALAQLAQASIRHATDQVSIHQAAPIVEPTTSILLPKNISGSYHIDLNYTLPACTVRLHTPLKRLHLYWPTWI